MRFYFEIFMVFFKIGMFTIGGGYAMIPLIKSEIVDKKRWMEEEEFLDTLAVAQSAPGAIAVNVAVFVGKRLGGYKGLLVTTLGSVLPSFLIILFIAMFFTGLKDNRYFLAAFKGIKPVVLSMILAPAITMSKKAGVTKKNLIIPIVIALLIALFNISAIYFIIVSMIIGNIYYRKRGE